jgi:hypothetical protein
LSLFGIARSECPKISSYWLELVARPRCFELVVERLYHVAPKSVFFDSSDNPTPLMDSLGVSGSSPTQLPPDEPWIRYSDTCIY